ncbi:MAG: hypothetical protein ABSF94_16180 [Steroidobacteraceae bacterium]|jgi:hypothetical protein
MSKETPKFTQRPVGLPDEPEPPDVAKTPGRPAGQVKFDSRGNAIFDWATMTGEFARDTATARLKKLENPTLSLADDAPTPVVKNVKSNPLGAVKGYNPYDSGKLGNKEVPKKKDLKKLSEWLALKKQAASNKNQDD